MASLAVLAPNPLFRAGLAALLNTMGFGPVEEASDLDELKKRANDRPRPDMVLVSVQQRAESPANQVQEVRSWAPDTKIVVLAPVLDVAGLSTSFAAGATGYLLENISRDGLERSLRLVAVGENVFPSDLAGVLPTSLSSGSGPVRTVGELRNLQVTDLEIDVLRGVSNGDSNGAIAKQLQISEAEVSAHIKRILRKLRLSNRTQAALWGVARGLAAPFAALTQLAESGDSDESPANSRPDSSFEYR